MTCSHVNNVKLVKNACRQRESCLLIWLYKGLGSFIESFTHNHAAPEATYFLEFEAAQVSEAAARRLGVPYPLRKSRYSGLYINVSRSAVIIRQL